MGLIVVLKTVKGEMGVGTLIIFISMLLVASVAAGVLISTTGSLQEKALSTGQQARTQIATNLKVVEISAVDGRNRSLRDFTQIAKLSPGSDPIKLSEMIMTFNTYTNTATLIYRGTGAPTVKNNSGFNTWMEQEMGQMAVFNWTNGGLVDWTYTVMDVDLDGDGIGDNVTTCRPFRLCPGPYDNYYIMFSLSSNGTDYFVQVINATDEPSNLGPGDEILANSNSAIDGLGSASTDGNTPGFWRLNPGQLTVQLPAGLLNEDLDNDQSDDDLVINNTHVIVRLSGAGEVPISLGTDLSVPGAVSVDADIVVNSTTYGNIFISGTTTVASKIDENVTFLVTPERVGSGYFVVEYLEHGSNFREGNVQRGDLIRFFYEAPENVGEDEEVRINFIPKVGSPTMSIFTTPSVISVERVYLYP